MIFTLPARMKYLWTILLCVLFLPSMAQQMRIEEFARDKKPLLGKAPFATDKQHALFDFYTNEKGFQFFIGDAAIPFTEGEGCITLTLPDRTEYLTVKHPEYGQLTWKIPGKELRKKKHYHAYLHTESLTKEYQQEKQWAVFTVNPAHAIVYVDSLIHPIQEGSLSLYLPIGTHSCRIESPFYQTWSDTIELNDSARFEKNVTLVPYYAYLTVETPFSDAQIWLDGKLIGTQKVATGRLTPGRYRLTISRMDWIYYDQFIEITNAERKVIDLHTVTMQPLRQAETQPGIGLILSGTTLATPDATLNTNGTDDHIPPTQSDSNQELSNIHITAIDAETEIWLNRERVGQGEWRGLLSPGFYAVSSKKDGLESRTRYFWVEEGTAAEWDLTSPMADYGLLNISCNELNATIFLNGVAVGTTPRVLQDLPVDRSYRVRLVKGRKTAETVVQLKGNDIVNVNLKLK